MIIVCKYCLSVVNCLDIFRFHEFIKQLHEFFDAFKTQLSYKEPEQDEEIATYFLPEVGCHGFC